MWQSQRMSPRQFSLRNDPQNSDRVNIWFQWHTYKPQSIRIKAVHLNGWKISCSEHGWSSNWMDQILHFKTRTHNNNQPIFNPDWTRLYNKLIVFNFHCVYDIERRTGKKMSMYDHTCQLSRIIRESPRYDANLPVSRTGHHISRIKSSFEFFCALVWDLAHFCSKHEFFLLVVRFLGHFCTYLVTDKDYFWHQRWSRILMVFTSRETSHNVTESHNFLMWLFIITWCGFFIIIREQ